jgi:hypothetical protein
LNFDQPEQLNSYVDFYLAQLVLFVERELFHVVDWLPVFPHVGQVVELLYVEVDPLFQLFVREFELPQVGQVVPD